MRHDFSAKNKIRKNALFGACGVFFLSFVALSAQAAQLATPLNPQQFLGGAPPEIGNTTLDQTGYTVCYETFCSTQSGATKGTVWTAEHLTRAQISRAKGASRKEMTFHPDTHIPYNQSASLSDYRGSGYDRGHMAPWADSADPDCFTLANIVPQNADNNRNLWEGVEEVVRDLTLRYGDVYVVTGPIFSGQRVLKLNNRVIVPTALYKAIYVPSVSFAAAYVTGNMPGRAWAQASINDIEDLTKTNVFPDLPDSLRNNSTSLPSPRVRGSSVGRSVDLGRLIEAARDQSGADADNDTHRASDGLGAHFLQHAGKEMLRNFMKNL